MPVFCSGTGAKGSELFFKTNYLEVRKSGLIYPPWKWEIGGSNPPLQTNEYERLFMVFFKGVEQASGSAVAEALKAKDKKLAEKLFKANTAKYENQYSEEDRQWFTATAKAFFDNRLK